MDKKEAERAIGDEELTTSTQVAPVPQFRRTGWIPIFIHVLYIQSIGYHSSSIACPNKKRKEEAVE